MNARHQAVIRPKCPVCDGPHPMRSCEKFLRLGPVARLRLIARYTMCANCLSPSHVTERCPQQDQNLVNEQRDQTINHKEVCNDLLENLSSYHKIFTSMTHQTFATNQDHINKDCVLCGSRHNLRKCKAFLELNSEQRLRLVLLHKLCTNCMLSTHAAEVCKSPIRCHVCQQRHHTMIHQEIRAISIDSISHDERADSPLDKVISESTKSEVKVPRKCQTCGGRHQIRSCRIFLKKRQEDRLREIVKHKLCVNCFSSLHATEICRSEFRCRVCNKKHHTLIHQEKDAAIMIEKDYEMLLNGGADLPPCLEIAITKSQGDERSVRNSSYHSESIVHSKRQTEHQSRKSRQIENREREIPKRSANVLRGSLQSGERELNRNQRFEPYSPRDRIHCPPQSLASTTVTIMPTAIVKLWSQGDWCKVRVQLDPCREYSAICSDFVKRLGLSVVRSTRGNFCSFELSSRIDNYDKITVNAVVRDGISCRVPSKTVCVEHLTHIRNLQLADPNFFEVGEVNIFVGGHVYEQILQRGLVSNGPGVPEAQWTKWGYLVSGSCTIRQ